MNKHFLIALLEDFSLDKIDVVSNDTKITEGIKGAFGSPGGKFFVAGKLISLFPEHKRYIEPFIGGGSILFRKKESKEEFINDRDEDIAFCFKFMQGITEQHVEALNKLDWTTKKTTFESMLKGYKESPSMDDPVGRFYRIVYLKAASDAGEMTSYDDRSEGEVMKVTSRLMKIKERLAGTKIENMDYKDFVKKYVNAESFVFLDPPYPSARMNWKWCPTQQEFESFTKELPGKWMVTYEVCDGWKESKYERKILSQYNCAAPSAGHMTRKSEMVITNYPMEENTSYLSESMMDPEEIKEVLNFVSSSKIININESEKSKLQSELKDILKLYASKRRGDSVKESFEELKKSFKECISKIIEAGITDFQPEKLQPFALELFDRYTEYNYTIVQPNGDKQAFKTLKELKDSNIDYRGYKFNIVMKEAEKETGNFVYYHQWWKNKHLENKKIENFIISTDLGSDFFIDENILLESFKESTFYIKPSKYEICKARESMAFVQPGTEFNMTSMPSWVKNIDIGKISILESSELEKKIEFMGDKLNGIYTAKRESENSDFWIIKKSS